MSALRDAADLISGASGRRSAWLTLASHCLGIDPATLPPVHDWNSGVVSAFLASRPYCLYFEPAFTLYYRFLTQRYGGDLDLLESDFHGSGHDIWKAIETAESIAVEIEGQNLGDLDPYEAVTRYLNPWYLRLVEQSLDSLLGLPVFRLLSDQGKQAPPKPRGIVEAIRAHGWFAAGEFYRPVVRNGIAHDVEFLWDTVITPLSVQYRDAGGNSEVLTYDELVDEVEGLSDECLAYAFAIRLFLLENMGNGVLQSVVRANVSNLGLRRAEFARVASSSALQIISVHHEIVNKEAQLRIECLDKTRIDEERLAELAAMLSSAHSWFPDADVLFVSLRSRQPVSFVRVPFTAVARWASGEDSDEEFIRSFDPAVLWPKKGRGFSRLRAKLARAVPFGIEAGRAEFRRGMQKVPGTLPNRFRILSLSDISHGLARRYRLEAVAGAASQEEIHEELHRLTSWIRRQNIYRNEQSKKRWRRVPPHYIAGFLYSREKRERDRGAFPGSGYYIGRFEWRDPSAQQDTLPLPMARGVSLGDGLLYDASPEWPPADIWVPR